MTMKILLQFGKAVVLCMKKILFLKPVFRLEGSCARPMQISLRAYQNILHKNYKDCSKVILKMAYNGKKMPKRAEIILNWRLIIDITYHSIFNKNLEVIRCTKVKDLRLLKVLIAMPKYKLFPSFCRNVPQRCESAKALFFRN